MALMVVFLSEAWRDYPAVLENDPAAWHAANPARVERGPFTRVVIESGKVIGWREGYEGRSETLATRAYDDPWVLPGGERLYNCVEVLWPEEKA